MPGSDANLTAQYSPSQLLYPRPTCGTKHQCHTYWISGVRCAGDLSFTCPANRLATSLVASGHPVFRYAFAYTPRKSLNEPSSSLPAIGSFHGAEIPFVFGTQAELSTDAERALSAAMGCYWSNFAWNNDPNNGTGRGGNCGLPGSNMTYMQWPMFGNGTLVFNISREAAPNGTNDSVLISTMRGFKKVQCEALDRYPIPPNAQLRATRMRWNGD